jgi:4-hydroxybenzoate polyprenyltransferase
MVAAADSVVVEPRSWTELVRRLHRRIHVGRSWHAAPFAGVGALAAARGAPTWGELALIALCLVFGRGYLVALLRALRAPEDVANPPTAEDVSSVPRAIWWAFAFHAALVLGFCAWLLNPVTFALSLALLVVLTCAAALRRRTAVAHALLGAGLAAAPVGAAVALTGAVDARLVGPALFGAGALAWAIGLDVLWSLQPRLREAGRRGAFPLPMALPVPTARTLARVAQWSAFAFFVAARGPLDFRPPYFAGVGAAALCLFVAHRRQRASDASDVDATFRALNLAVGPCLFVGALLGL